MCIMTLLGYHKSLKREHGIRPVTLKVSILLVLFTFIGIPCASPFGTEAHQRYRGHHEQSSAVSIENRFQVKKLWTPLRSNRISTADEKTQDSDWKDGELQAGLISRILYFYAEPLLKLSALRPLEVEDAFHIPTERRMEALVPSLQQIYNRCRSKAHKRLETYQATSESAENNGKLDLKKRMNGRIDRSKTLILAKAIFIHQKAAFIKTGLLRLTNTIIQAFPAILVSRLLRLIELGEANHPSKALLTTLTLITLLSIKMIVENKFFYNIVKGATEIRGSLTGMIFDKSLRISSSAALGVRKKGETNVSQNETAVLGSGSVINLMQLDATVIETLALQVHTLWDGLLQISIYATLLFKYLGKPVIWGILVLLLTIPTNSLTLRMLNRMSKAELEAKDARSKKTTEAIQNMKLLKLQGWASCFQNEILIHRTDELKRYLAKGKYKALNTAISNAVPAIVLVVTLTAYRATGKPLLASTIFTAISLFNQLRFPLFFYPNLIDAIANGKNSLRRISSYLSQDELSPYVRYLPLPECGGNISMVNGNFLWSTSTIVEGGEGNFIKPALRGVDLQVKAGECVAVIGPVGSGKSALIKALLGELAPVPRLVVDQHPQAVDQFSVSPDIVHFPAVVCSGAIGYCAQEPWLTKGTLRDAILFGRPYDKERYLAAICASGLDSEIYSIHSSLTHETDVGEGGSSISGGQRARVQLARALYGNDVGVYLLDDPFSALDSHVGTIVFERFINLSKRRKAASIIVTHDPSVSRRCDRVILMGKSHNKAEPSCGHIVDVGTYDELISRGHDIRNINISDKVSSEESISFGINNTDIAVSKQTDEKFRLSVDFECQSQTVLEYDPECIVEHQLQSTNGEAGTSGTNTEVSIKRKTIPTTLDDAMSRSTIPLSTYIGYLKSVNSPLLITATLLSFITANGAQLFQQFIIARWTELDQGILAPVVTRKYLNLLMYAATVSSVFLWLRSFLLMLAGTRASTYLYNKLLSSVFRAPIMFFDSTPSGQLLSRFGREMDVVDRSVPDGIGSVLFCFLQISLSIMALAGAVTPFMLVPLFGIGTMYTGIMSRFRPAARELKRCESKSRSPIYTQFGEALRGVEIIRSFPGAVSSWSLNNRHLVDRNFAVFYSIKALDRWLSVRLETLGNVVVLVAAISSIYLTRAGTLKPGTAGWGLTQALSITGLLTWAVRVLTDLESQMMSVVRISEMIPDASGNPLSSPWNSTKTIPVENEAPGVAFGTDISPILSLRRSPCTDKAIRLSGWPWKGGVEFKNVSMRYQLDLPLALQNVNISVPPGSTLAVVGKTGSGKSSLLLTLFRLVEIEKHGSIEIDHVDIRSISLQSLREILSIIPQDPILFSGSLKYNLDATGNVSEEDAWRALDAACPELANQARLSGLGLDFPINEGGKNLSAGQRQLVCLARALVRKTKILVMDEATSSIDQKTDFLVQKIIQNEFVQKGVSVITVAHRLDTILGYDKIAVFGAGQVLEFDTPAKLLARPNGELRMLFNAYRSSRQRGLLSKELVQEKQFVE